MKKRYYYAILIIILILLPISLTQFKKSTNSGSGYSKTTSERLEKTRDPNGTQTKRQRSATSKKYKDPRVRRFFEQTMSPLDVDRFDSYLKLNNRNPRSLISVYSLTDDKAILAELKQHLDVPEVLICLCQSYWIPAAEKLKYINMYIKSNPNEMQGYMLASAISLECGEPKERILELVQKGITSQTLSLGSDTISSDMRNALITSGMDDTNAEIHLAINDQYSASQLLIGLNMLLRASDIAVEGASGSQEKNAIISDYIRTSESFKELSPYANRNIELAYYSAMYKLLAKLDGEVDLGTGFGNSNLFLERLKKEDNEFNELRKTFNDRLQEAPPELVDQYFEKRSISGDRSAQEWFLNQTGK